MGLYKQPGSPYWNFRFSWKGRRISGSTRQKDKKLAAKIYEDTRAKFVLGRTTGERKPIRFRDLAQRFLDEYAVNKRSHKDDVSRAGKLNAFFGDDFVNEIDAAMVDRYKESRLHPKDGRRVPCVATVNRELALMRSIFNWGMRDNLVKDNPIRKGRARLFSEKGRELDRYLNDDEQRKLLACCSPILHRLVLVGLRTGLRQGELLRLEWSDVDPVNKTLAIRRTKSGETRHIPIHPDVAAVLNAMPRLGKLIFHDGFGHQLSKHGRIKAMFRKAVEKSGLRGRVLFHTLRHSFASGLVQRGVDLLSVSELLGHSSVRMSQRYSHLASANLQGAVNLLPSAGTEKADQPTVPDVLEMVEMR